jgi:hypothetical protein
MGVMSMWTHPVHFAAQYNDERIHSVKTLRQHVESDALCTYVCSFVKNAQWGIDVVVMCYRDGEHGARSKTERWGECMTPSGSW